MKIPPEAYYADYHETDEATFLVYDLGRLSLEWSMVEHFFAALIWELLGDFPTGKTLTGNMGNQSRADVILGLARQRLKEPAVLDSIEFACKAFNTLRENRNFLIHAHSISPPENGKKPLWRRSGKGQGDFIGTEADLADLETVIAQICDLGKFVIELVPHRHPRHSKRLKGKLPPLPDKFPPPCILTQIHPEEPSNNRRPPRASRKSPKSRSKESS